MQLYGTCDPKMLQERDFAKKTPMQKGARLPHCKSLPCGRIGQKIIFPLISENVMYQT